MVMNRRTRRLFQILVFLTFLLGAPTYWIIINDLTLPLWLKLILASLPFCVLPFAIGWINPARWWDCAVGIVVPFVSALVDLFIPPHEQSRDLLALAFVFLLLLIALSFAYLGRLLGQRRLHENAQAASITEGPLNRFGVLSTLLLIALSCVVLWTIFFLKIPVNVTLMDGRILAQPVISKGWSGLRYDVENQGTQPHQFIMIYTQLPEDRLPVNNGTVSLGSPGIMVIDDGLQHVDSHDSLAILLSSPPLQPGEKRGINYGFSGLGAPIGSQTITILCNLPGHYELGEFTSVTFTE